MLVSSPSNGTIKLADYVFARLHQLGVRSVFGVPGDYNLKLLDFVEPSGLHWVGNCNELNAAYAADAYARLHGISALVTTFGVGELSAVNGIAGAFAEKAPIVHIVGTPSRTIQENRVFMHHAFPDADYRRFAEMHSHVTAAQTNLTDPRLAPNQVDWIIEQALLHQRPVYLEIPDDMVNTLVSSSNLHDRPSLQLPDPPEIEAEASGVQCLLDRVYSAKRPLILVDGESRSLGILEEIDQLIKATQWPTWTTVFGKGLVNEELPNVYGVDAGKFGADEAFAYHQSADLILHLGPHLSDTNTNIFTTIPPKTIAIVLSQNTLTAGANIYRDILPARFLQRLLKELKSDRLVKVDGPPNTIQAQPEVVDSDPLVQKHFYSIINPILRKGDVVLAETGTASYGGRTMKLPPGSRFFTAVTWLSIGYMLPATLGAALAQRDMLKTSLEKGAQEANQKRRAILFMGDGSLQMTAQELSIIIQEKLNVTIFVINNNGYTIERVIHGRKQAYNGIAKWDHAFALRLFGMDEETASKSFFRAKTWGELKTVLASPDLKEGEGVKVVEVFMGQEDCTGPLLDLLQRQVAQEGTAP
ncbi:uncharacterized protein JN550_000764 [Neoarthrinium moseri]|uniref:uncharacterized protein n=1 Tax=Neoarthrinium moseri TaxID=1658444 RepID=UPI001FDDE0E2|nr:uncharacterized protein JN550_000764 [Neoarthrinium moseri]KAI1876692.1 hypothetical protein JN550_000764 [Neoarthrinium moseri]